MRLLLLLRRISAGPSVCPRWPPKGQSMCDCRRTRASRLLRVSLTHNDICLRIRRAHGLHRYDSVLPSNRNLACLPLECVFAFSKSLGTRHRSYGDAAFASYNTCILTLLWQVRESYWVDLAISATSMSSTDSKSEVSTGFDDPFPPCMPSVSTRNLFVGVRILSQRGPLLGDRSPSMKRKSSIATALCACSCQCYRSATLLSRLTGSDTDDPRCDPP